MKNPLNTPAGITRAQQSIKVEPSKGQAAGDKQGKKIPKKITENYLYNSGLYYLERYAASTARFRAVMSRKIDRSCRCHPEQDREECIRLLEKTILKFQEFGYLNDDNYTQTKVSSLLGRGLSRRMIIMKLKQAGISEAHISAALDVYAHENQTTAEDAEMAAALKLARKKRVGPFAQGQSYDRNKTIAAFARAGFSFDTIRKVLDLPQEEFF